MLYHLPHDQIVLSQNGKVAFGQIYSKGVEPFEECAGPVEELRDLLPTLHRRASDWYEQHGDRSEAIRHALAGEDFEHAAGLIELAIPELRLHRQDAALVNWIQTLPDETVRRRPVLNVGLAGALAFAEVEDRLREAEQSLAAALGSAAVPIVVDKEQFRRLPGEIELFRSALAQIRGDMDGVIAHARRVLLLAPAEDHLARAGASGFLGIAFWTTGELVDVYRGWSDCLEGLQRAGHVADALASTIAPVDICLVQGRLAEAFRLCESALDFAAVQGAQNPRGAADVHVALADLNSLQGDAAAAQRHLLMSEELGERGATPRWHSRWRITRALLRLAEGDHDAANGLLAEAERVYIADFYPDVRPLAAMKARVWIKQGNLAEAFHWAAASGVTVDDELNYLQVFEHITLARLRLAEETGARIGKSERGAITFLDRLLEAAAGGGRMGSVIEILVLQALARQARGDAAGALFLWGVH